MTAAKKITGVEAQRVRIRAEAIRGIQDILDLPRGGIKNPRTDWLSAPPLHAFKRIELRLADDDSDDWWIFRPEDCTPQVLWPINVSLGFITPGNGATIGQFRSIRAKEARGYVNKFGPYMLRHDLAQMDNGKLFTASGVHVWLGGEWIDASQRTRWSSSDEQSAIPTRDRWYKRDRDQGRLAIGAALRQRYEWAVALGFENTPTIRFATDPTGIKEVFKLRDLPAGRDRRDALLTWVSDHWRQDRRDEDVERYVRKHVRGATGFEWSGMCGEVLPSVFDLEQLERLKAERDAMREAGADVRRRNSHDNSI